MPRREPLKLPSREDYLDESDENVGDDGSTPRIQETKNARIRLLHPEMKPLEEEPDPHEARARAKFLKANVELLPNFEEMLDYLQFRHKIVGIKKTKGALVRDALRLLWLEYQQLPESGWRAGIPALRGDDE